MMRNTLFSVLVLVLAACAADPSRSPKALPHTPPDKMGIFGVGRHVQSMPLPEVAEAPPLPHGQKQAELTIWYPVDRQLWLNRGGRGRTLFNHVSGLSVPDLPIADGYEPFPLIVFSHGLAGTRDQNPYQFDWWVSRGYVVVSMNHYPSTLFDIIANGGETDRALESALRRPAEVLAEIDETEKWNADYHHFLYRKLDSSRVMVAGHSFGGYSALAVSGAKGGIKQFIEACDADARMDDTFQCRIAREYKGRSIEKQYSDPRIVSIMPMTPGATGAFTGGLGSIRIPIFYWGAEEDDVVEPDIFLDWMWDELNSPKIYAWIPGAGHNDFSQLCLSGLPINCGSHDVLEPQQILTLINELGTAFADWTIRQDVSAKVWLEQAGVRNRWPLRYEVSWR